MLTVAGPVLLGTIFIWLLWLMTGKDTDAASLKRGHGEYVRCHEVERKVRKLTTSSARNSAAFVSMFFYHLQMSTINLQIPSFPFPPFLKALGRWMADYLATFNFGSFALLECNSGAISEIARAIIIVLLAYLLVDCVHVKAERTGEGWLAEHHFLTTDQATRRTRRLFALLGIGLCWGIVGLLVDAESNALSALAVKLLFTDVVFSMVIFSFWYWAIRNCDDELKAHARNAQIALYSLAVTSLTQAHVAGVDCTNGKLDVLPGKDCGGGFWWLGVLGLSVFCVVAPLALLWKLSNIRHLEAMSPKRQRLEDSYAWVLTKYKDKRWWFETYVIIDKVLHVVASGARTHGPCYICKHPFLKWGWLRQ
ncbi:hypothetical protein N9K47_00040 [bacterium]|nr:hypothetical protein [bacterium]